MARALLAVTLVASAAAAGAEPARPIPPDAVPAELAPVVLRANDAIDELRDRLVKRLMGLLQQGGAREALGVCPTEAPRIEKQVGDTHHLAIGRTSFRLRNAANAPRPWAAAYVAAAAGKKGEEVKPAVFDLGDRLGVLRPIVTLPTCTRCHGPAEAIAPEVKDELARRYPKDQGTGFAAGDVRGFVWVEVQKPR
jgi:hypothetical protein